MSAPATRATPRGSPLLMLVAVLGTWTGARALWWENPFPAAAVLAPVLAPLQTALPVAQALPSLSPAAGGAVRARVSGPVIARVQLGPPRQAGLRGGVANLAAPGVVVMIRPLDAPPAGRPAPSAPQLAAAHQLLYRAALHRPVGWTGLRDDGGLPFAPQQAPAPREAGTAPFLPALDPARRTARRWTLDAWGFWREGSDATPISQGRVPIYGASQIGAVLQYSLAPRSRRDPRLFMRAYRSLVRRGESEVSLGASVRPFPRLPLRAAAEVRYTDAAFTNEVRPAVFAVTELPPVALPLGTQLEAYGQAGWVGGASRTAFADGQASLTRPIEAVGRASHDKLRLSIGAAAWGGAQRDAERLDVGPTLRLDLKVGKVPARLSVDWRERVAGSAGPESGIAATLSTHF